MEDKYFRPAGNLDSNESRVSIIPKLEGNKYFKPAGDLDEKNEVIPANLKNEINHSSLSLKEIEDYLLTVVSGEKYDAVCELGVLMGSGRIIASLEQVKKMVSDGYNIVSANVLNASADIIEVEFQRYVYNEELIEKRRRF